MSTSGNGGKSRRSVRATRPGAVSVPASEEPDSIAGTAGGGPSDARRIQDEGLPSRLSSRALPSVGSSAVASLPAVEEPGVARAPSTRSTSSASSGNKAKPSADKKVKRKVSATFPGAVAVMSEEAEGPQEPAAIVTTSRTKSEASMSADSTSMRKKKRGTAASKPGAVSVSGDDEPVLVDEKTGGKKVVSSSAQSTTTAVTASYGMTKAARVSTGVALIPGAVSVQGSGGGGGGGVASVQLVQNAEQGPESQVAAKSKEKGFQNLGATTPGAAAVAGPGPAEGNPAPGAHAVTGAEANEHETAVRRKDPRASARRKARNTAAAAALSGDADGDDSHGDGATGASESRQSDNRHYQRRMEEKLLQMERDLGQSGGRRGDPRNNDASRNDDSNRDDGRDALLKDTTHTTRLHNEESGNKDGVEEEQQRQTSISRGPQAEIQTSAPATMADRGLAGAPGVEYGTTTAGYGGPGYGGMDGDENLAVAIAVEEEEELFFPAAIEFDPDSKPPLHKNRRFRLYAIAGTLLLIVVIVGASVAIVASKNRSSVSLATVPPTPSPTTTLEGTFMSQFSKVVGDEVYIKGTPHNLAADWIMYKDPLQLPPDSINLIQRYLAAMLYYQTSTNGLNPWRSCNPPDPEMGETSACVFQKFVRRPDDSVGYDPQKAKRWLSGEHECEWVGILCDSLKITRALDMMDFQLTGTIPTEISLFPYLQSISIPFNNLTGTIPSIFASMRHLVNFEVHYNGLTGTIPNEYWKANALLNFNIGQNMLSGTLSPDVVRLSNLKGLHIFENMLNGTFPSEVGELFFLTFTRVHHNRFTGTLPTELGQLELLQEMWMHFNEFTGTIPSELGLLPDLKDLRIHANDLSGTTPLEIYNNTKLSRLDIYDMHINGTISTLIGQLTKLEQLRLKNNDLTGTIPSELGNIKSLRLAWLHLNEMTGSMPEEVCNNRGPTTLNFLQTDCDPQENPPVYCDRVCCTACCDRFASSKLCLKTGGNS